MTPPLPSVSWEAATAAASETDPTPICTIVIIIATQNEVQPLVNRFKLTEAVESVFPKGVPWVRYHAFYKNLDLNVIWPGKDATQGVDSVGTVSAAMVTYATIQALQPDLIINAGTADGLKAKSAAIGDVYLVSDVCFHDRRIPMPVKCLYGISQRKALSTPKLAEQLNLKVGKLSTGSSLDMSPWDESLITANDATIKDMEAAAVAYVADLLKVPCIFVKIVTSIVDGDKPTSEEFLHNLASGIATLDETVAQVIDFINGKCLSEL